MHILLIARHYPPEISGGARRPALLTESFRRMGHRVTLVTPFGDDADPDLIRVTTQPILNAQAAANEITSIKVKGPTLKERMKNVLRLWLYWPDPNITWARAVRDCLKDNDIRPDWIMTTSPPESTHLAGRALSIRWGIPWLAEFRDTWIENAHRPELSTSSLRRWFERRIARRTFKRLTAVTGVSDAVMQDARKLIPAGTPEHIFGHFSSPAQRPMVLGGSDETHLVHTGGFSLSDRRRKLDDLMRALTALNDPNLHLHIAGPLTGEEESLCSTVTGFKVTHHGRVSLEIARAMQSGADGLLLVTPKDSHALPGKYAEYRQARKPIYYLGGGDWLGLIGDKKGLFPLKEGLKQAEDYVAGDEGVDVVSAESAAASLIDFMTALNRA